MMNRLKERFNHAPLATKIRYSYILIVFPLLFMSLLLFNNMWNIDKQYKEMINVSVLAGEFSMDFKKDFDYETYLVVVGNKSFDESDLGKLLEDARRVIGLLENTKSSNANVNRIRDVKKYLNNLEIYIGRIRDNLLEDNRYEDNIEIWENDVQIVTELVQNTMSEFIYYEVSDLQKSRENYQISNNILIRVLLIAYAVILIMVIVMSYYIPMSITRPIRRLSDVTNQVAQGDLSVRADANDGGTEVTALSESLNSMIDKINALLEQVTTEQIRLRKAEFELLQSQINPHFLYNTLDAIVWLAESGEQKKVVHMVESLSSFFRASLNQGKDINSIKNEIAHVRSYLEIQKVRYQDILDYEIDIPEEIYQNTIPKITLQPLVENALYHGIKNKRGGGKITITAEMFPDSYVIYVKDNGIGIQPERLAEIRDGITNKKPQDTDIYGIYNVNERIRLNCGEKYGIELFSEYQNGTTAEVKLPYNL